MESLDQWNHLIKMIIWSLNSSDQWNPAINGLTWSMESPDQYNHLFIKVIWSLESSDQRNHLINANIWFMQSPDPYKHLTNEFIRPHSFLEFWTTLKCSTTDLSLWSMLSCALYWDIHTCYRRYVSFCWTWRLCWLSYKVWWWSLKTASCRSSKVRFFTILCVVAQCVNLSLWQLGWGPLTDCVKENGKQFE